MSEPPRRRVMIVDDHATFADLLALALDTAADLCCVGSARTVGSAVALAAATRPDVAIVDVMLGGEDGLAAVRQLRAASAEMILAVVSAKSDVATMTRAAAAGADAFIPKSGRLDELLDVLRSAHTGTMIVARSVFDPREHHAEAVPAGERLTAREFEVLGLMGRAATATQIARILGISLHTCRGYIRAVHTKLGVSTQLEAVVKAQEIGLLPRSPDG